MMLSAPRRWLAGLLILGWYFPTGPAARGQEMVAESNYVKLLKRAPEARRGAIIGVIGTRGDARDLAYLLDRATAGGPDGWPADSRRRALEALAEAVATRDLRPSGGLDRLNPLILGGPDLDTTTRLAAVRLAKAWRLPTALPALIDLAAADPGNHPMLRDAALDALAGSDAPAAREALLSFVTRRADAPDLQRAALIAMVRLDLDFAASHAVGLIAASHPGDQLAKLLAAFLDQKGGAERLAAAITANPPGIDGAKLALRGLATLGRTDASLAASLNKIAGVQADPPPPGPAEMAQLIAEVAHSGDPARGERIFRQVELNCMNCHAVAGAGGGIGPDLSALGSSSPVDYIVNSILMPDQAIKEEYQTRVLSTSDGLVVHGIVVEEDDRRVVLKDALGEKRSIPRSAIEDSKKGGSLMPKGLTSPLTRGEFVDLVRFLAELGKPGLYAIRPTPTIQRWQALRAVTPAQVDGASLTPLDPKISEADASRWVPTYAWVDGHLTMGELRAISGGPDAIVRGEITVSAAGPVEIRFGSLNGRILSAWIDSEPIAVGTDGKAVVRLVIGLRTLTVRIQGPAPDAAPLRVEIARVAGSAAEFSVVGGR